MNEKLAERFFSTRKNVDLNLEPERGIVADMLRRGIKIAPLWLLFVLLIWGTDGVCLLYTSPSPRDRG